jgi:beta-glucosidase
MDILLSVIINIKMKTSTNELSFLNIIALSLFFGNCQAQQLIEAPVYKNPVFTIEQRIDDLLLRMTIEEKVGQMNMPCVYKQRIGWGLELGPVSIHRQMTLDERFRQMEGCRKFARGDHNDQIGQGGGFFTLADRIIYEGTLKQAEFFNELQQIAINESRLGIPVLQIEEGTHGFMCAGGTVFPEGLAIGSTWNLDLVRQMYAAVAK